MDKNAIKKYAVWAREELIKRVSTKAEEYGISKENIIPADTEAVNGHLLTKAEITQRHALISKIKSDGYEQVMEEAAYTWFNRFIALRFMEVNNYLPTHIRVFTDEQGSFDPQILTEAIHLELDGLNRDKVIALKQENKTEELFKYLIITQCNALNSILPGMFQRIDHYTELLFPDNILRKGSVIEQMVTLIPEEDWKDAVQIIGWLYQYYNSEKHDQIINIYKGTIKKDDIPAATQLFTTDWVVRYMVDNSLGRYWIERNPESKLAEKLTYFVTPKDGKINYINEKVLPQDLTFFDPCMGSGHILVYAFDVLMEIYRECGYSDRDAALNIIQNNLFGLDIDRRAYQLAYFAVMMKARSYNRRALTQGLWNNISVIEESNELDGFNCQGITNDKAQNKVGKYLIDVFRHAKEIGSLQTVEKKDYKAFSEYLLNLSSPDAQLDLFSSNWIASNVPAMLKLVKQASIMSNKYAVVCTNPPYMNKLESHLKDFVVNNYKAYSGDLFSVFMYRNFGYCKKDGYSAFMTPFVWMFIKTYEPLRNYILDNKSITTLVQMEYSAFEEATVPICSFVLQNGKTENKSLCFRLSDFKGGMEVQKQKVLEAQANKDCGYFYESAQDNFSKIPGSPIAYWVSEKFVETYEDGTLLGSIAFPKTGMTTGDNGRFLRLWSEVDKHKVNVAASSAKEAINSQMKWFPYCKGGGFKRWYGYNEYYINWYDNGYEIKNNIKDNGLKAASVRSENLYFKPLITWSAVTSGLFSCRYCFGGALFDSGGSSISVSKNAYYLLALLNSNVGQYILNISNATINYQPGDIAGVPVVLSSTSEVEEMASSNIDIAKSDWDSFETSWDFTEHPLVKWAKELWDCTAIGATMSKFYGENEPKKVNSPLELCYKLWQGECDERFNTLKANEEELNRIFIDIYGLQDELTPEEDDKDVTVRKADLQRDIKSLISYAVGCMFGRYSLDVEGLAYAGGEWDKHKYRTFIPDRDNIIPICDDEYFNDDVTGRFINWVETVYGKDTLEENLRYIADALGGKGSAREVIRSYFINDFYADHLKIYQKRPIYWLFDSGKKGGFKALIYMHRYQPDTIARMRTDYVHEQQARYRTAIADLEHRISMADTAERVKLNKQLEKVRDQDAELRTYEEKIHHLADQMVRIDLDDGVKHNYEIFKDVLAPIK